MSGVYLKNRNYENVLQKRLILKNIKKNSPGKYPMLLYVAVSIRWISIRFDAILINEFC